MEKVYMEAPRRNTNTWRSEDISPYDFRDENPQTMPQDTSNRLSTERGTQNTRTQERIPLENQTTQESRIRSNLDNRISQDNRTQYPNRYISEEDEYDMDAIMNEMNELEDIEYDCNPELDMYDNGNIDWRWNEDVSQRCPKNMTMDRKTIVEEENPKRKTTTWMRVKREY